MYSSSNKDNNIFSQDLTITAPHFSPAAVCVPPPVLENNFLKQLHLNLRASNLNSVSPTRKNLPTHSFSKDKAMKRKILTAHGLRDRRVRLSMMVARKFFDLQDTLAFDKASETIGWLLTKSKPAIDELVKIKHNSSFTRKWSRSTSTEASEIGDKRNKYQHLKSKPIISTFPVVDKESRAKARARARERTRTKLLIRNLSESKKVLPDFRIPQYHSSTWNNLSSHNN